MKKPSSRSLRWLTLFLLTLLVGLLSRPAAGAQVETLATGLSYPTSIVVDGVYASWTEGLVDNYIKWTNKAGASPVYNYHVGTPGLHTHSLAQDTLYLYFGLWTPPGSFLNVHPNVGSQIVRLLKSIVPQSPQPLFKFTDPEIFNTPWAFDAGYYGPMEARLGSVFFAVNNFANSQAEEVRKVSNQGVFYPNLVPLLGTADQLVEITCLTTDDTWVYWGEKYQDGTGAIRRAPLVGGLSSPIATLNGFCTSLVAPTSGTGSGKLFWLDFDPKATFPTAVKVCSPGGVPSTLASFVFPFTTDGSVALTVDAVNVYYFGIDIQTAQFAVMQFPIKGGSPTVLATGLHFPVGLTGDGGYVYWTDQGGTAGGPGLGSVNRVAKNVTMKADFSANPATGYPPLPVQFTDASSGAIDTWEWDFGDTATSTDQNPSHTYSLAANYKVTLKVTGPNGSSTKTATVKVKKWPKPKTAFTATPKTGPAPLLVQFNDASTGPPGSMTGWYWDFGDGGSSAEQNSSHTYTTPGNYKVTLTVTGPGGSKSKSTTIKVTAP